MEDHNEPSAFVSPCLSPCVLGTFFTVSKKRLVYATERGFLSLSNTTLIKHNVPRAMVRIPSDHNCLGSSLPRLILRFVVGYDTALLNGLFYTFHGKGYVLDPAEDVVYNFNAYDTQSWALMDFVSPADLLERLLAKIALFVFVFVVLVLYRSLVSYLCRKVFLPLFLQLGGLGCIPLERWSGSLIFRLYCSANVLPI